jgi:hypothetical protein
MILAGAFGLTAAWCLLPVALLLTLRLPAFTWGHEPIGVRFFEAWLPLRERGNYPFVIVGWLLDLFHRGLLFVLLQLGFDPERDFVRTMTTFADASIGIHAGLMILVLGIVTFDRRLPLASRLAALVTGASLGYLFHWSPLGLLVADFPLTRILLVCAFLAFSVRRLEFPLKLEVSPPSTPSSLVQSAAPIAALASAMLFLEPTLVPYVLLVFIVGVVGLPWRRLLTVVSAGLGMTAVCLAGLWVCLMQGDLPVQRASILVNALRFNGPVEPYFRFGDFMTPGTYLFVPFLSAIAWCVIPAAAFVWPGNRRHRIIPIAVMLGLLFYLYVFIVRRPGVALTSEILVYLAATGVLSIFTMRPGVRRAGAAIWCAALLAQMAYTVTSALPPVIAYAQNAAAVAGEIDRFARSYDLPILYVFAQHGKNTNRIIHSAPSAAFKGVEYCWFRVAGNCPEQERNRWLSPLVSPYRMVGEPRALPRGPFVLMISDIIGEKPSMAQENAIVAEALLRSRGCKVWDSYEFVIRICEIRSK